MRKKKNFRVFGRETDQRRALLRSLALSLVVREKIRTTEAKAKELRPFIEKLITRSREDNTANRRIVISKLGSERGAAKLFSKIGPKYIDRKGGYTRVVKLPQRLTDGAKMAIIEFV